MYKIIEFEKHTFIYNDSENTACSVARWISKNVRNLGNSAGKEWSGTMQIGLDEHDTRVVGGSGLLVGDDNAASTKWYNLGKVFKILNNWWLLVN